jgi:FkbM family methyltransferase
MTFKYACHKLVDRAVESVLSNSDRLPTYYGGRVIWPTRTTWSSVYWPYEPYMARAMRQFLRQGSVFWDIGANVGWFSLFASSLVGPSGAVEAFEPSPDVFRALRSNLENRANAKTHNIGIADTDEIREFSAQGMSPAASFVEEVTKINAPYFPNNQIERVSVATTRLDTLMTSRVRPDLLKIDVEGYEFRALRGAERLLDTSRPAILMEIHPPQLELSGGSEDGMFDLLRAHRYRWTTLHKNENSLYTILATST